MFDLFDNITPDETLFIPEDVELSEWIRQQVAVVFGVEEDILKENRDYYRSRSV